MKLYVRITNIFQSQFWILVRMVKLTRVHHGFLLADDFSNIISELENTLKNSLYVHLNYDSCKFRSNNFSAAAVLLEKF